MYNANLPSKDELPSSKQLIKSTLLALLVAILILVTLVLPAEYAVDPTGVGRWLGLTDMGEIKRQLAEEAEADRTLETAVKLPSSADDSALRIPEQTQQSIAESNAADVKVEVAAKPAPSAWKDTVQFVLTPGQGTEYKLVMQRGAVAQYAWVSDGGPINFDAHGNGREAGQRRSISYEKGRGVDADQGHLTAAFTGNHGWFFRNRNKHPVTVTLNLKGDYTELKKII
jgi:hypothetical protein